MLNIWKTTEEESKFVAGDTIKCVDTEQARGLTNNKLYEAVMLCGSDVVVILNDNNVLAEYKKRRFKFMFNIATKLEELGF